MERFRAKEELLHRLLSPSVEGLGYELWGIEYFARGSHCTLRVFIDSEIGISVDDCAMVSNQISAVLDVEDPINEVYELEVSSPGIDRRLFFREQYFSFIGEHLDLRLRIPFEGRKKYKGRLSEVLLCELIVDVDNQKYRLPFDILERVRVQPAG